MRNFRSLPRQFANWLAMTMILSVLLSCTVTAAAAEGTAIYNGRSGELIFAPGSDYSPTDLFPNFKNVIPGDSITQPITIKNDASDYVKIKVYMRALGAHEDSVDFLSKLHLRVEKSETNSMEYMFDAAANETAQLSEWVYLGTLYSGGEINLNVVLDVPVELDNSLQNLVGYLDWEFMIEEYPVDPSDPKPPQTGDDSQIYLWSTLMGVSFVLILFLLLFRKRKDKEKQ